MGTRNPHLTVFIHRGPFPAIDTLEKERERALVFSCAWHTRLGVGSPVHALHPHILHSVLKAPIDSALQSLGRGRGQRKELVHSMRFTLKDMETVHWRMLQDIVAFTTHYDPDSPTVEDLTAMRAHFTASKNGAPCM
eukprot:2402899-Rhodomonas_salina.1